MLVAILAKIVIDRAHRTLEAITTDWIHVAAFARKSVVDLFVGVAGFFVGVVRSVIDDLVPRCRTSLRRTTRRRRSRTIHAAAAVLGTLAIGVRIFSFFVFAACVIRILLSIPAVLLFVLVLILVAITVTITVAVSISVLIFVFCFFFVLLFLALFGAAPLP